MLTTTELHKVIQLTIPSPWEISIAENHSMAYCIEITLYNPYKNIYLRTSEELRDLSNVFSNKIAEIVGNIHKLIDLEDQVEYDRWKRAKDTPLYKVLSGED